MKALKGLSLLLLTLVVSACSIDASLLSLEQVPSIASVVPPPSPAEFVSGSTGPYQTSSNRGYKIQASVGHYLPNFQATSTNRGYVMYSTIQGNMISEE